MSKIALDPVLAEDISSAADTSWIEWEKFRNKRVAVSGATGLLGRNLIDTLLEANDRYGLNCQLVALVRDPEKAQEIFGETDERTLKIVKQDVMDPVDEAVRADFLVHTASTTASRQMIEQPVETIMTTLDGTRNMLDFAVRCKMQGVVYLSSMEAYGIVEPGTGRLKEPDLGKIDLTNVRNGYAEGKRMAECLCAAYAKEYGLPVRVARLAQTFGAGISREENRVFAQFARSVLKGEDIVLHTPGEKANCYCYTSDAVLAILLLLTKGENGQAYNVANMETFCSIRGLAEEFLRHDETGKCQLRIEIPEDPGSLGYAPDSALNLNSEKIMALGWKPSRNLPEMTERLLKSLKMGL